MLTRAALGVCAVVLGALSASRGAQRGLGGSHPVNQGLDAAQGPRPPVVQCMPRRQAFADRERPTLNMSVQNRGEALGCPLETLMHVSSGHSAHESAFVIPLNQPATRAAQRRSPERCCYNAPSSLPTRPNG